MVTCRQAEVARGADNSTFWSTDSRRQWATKPGLSFWDLKAYPLVIAFLQQSHTYSKNQNKTKKKQKNKTKQKNPTPNSAISCGPVGPIFIHITISHNLFLLSQQRFQPVVSAGAIIVLTDPYPFTTPAMKSPMGKFWKQNAAANCMLWLLLNCLLALLPCNCQPGYSFSMIFIFPFKVPCNTFKAAQ